MNKKDLEAIIKVLIERGCDNTAQQFSKQTAWATLVLYVSTDETRDKGNDIIRLDDIKVAANKELTIDHLIDLIPVNHRTPWVMGMRIESFYLVCCQP